MLSAKRRFIAYSKGYGGEMAQPQVNLHDLSKQVMALRQGMAKMREELKLRTDADVDRALVVLKRERQQDIYRRDKPWLAQNKSFLVSDNLCRSCRNPNPHHLLVVKRDGNPEEICPYLLIIGLARLNILRNKNIEFDPDKIIAMAKNGKKKKETL